MAIAAIRTLEVQLVLAEAYGKHIEVGKLLEDIAFYENRLAKLATTSRTVREARGSRPNAADQRLAASDERAAEPEERPLTRRHQTKSAQAQGLGKADTSTAIQPF